VYGLRLLVKTGIRAMGLADPPVGLGSGRGAIEK